MLTKIKNLLYSNAGLFVLAIIFLLMVYKGLFSPVISENPPVTNSIDTTINKNPPPAQLNNPSFFLPASEPTKLSIPKINILADFEAPLGLNDSGEVQVPTIYSKVGWYKYSPTPGEFGPAVVFGHVDSRLGPAVFYSLGQLQAGDDIYIERVDGTTAHFQVDFFERYEQKEFPTAEVYGNIDYAGLRLITCSGIYLRGQQRYTHNLVVYAKLVE